MEYVWTEPILHFQKKVNTLKDMSEAMKAMPQYQEMIDKYSIHINLASAAMTEFENRKLASIAALEQVF